MEISLKNKQLLFVIALISLLGIVCFFERDELVFHFSLNKAYYYSEHEQYENAIREYDSLIEMKPDVYELYVNKAILLATHGEYDEALTVFGQAESLNNADPELYYNLAHLYELMGNEEMYQQFVDKGAQLEAGNQFESSDFEEGD